MNNILRLCLDLNIWCAVVLANKKGWQNTACQSLVNIVQKGTCELGSVQLIISWGMLNHLYFVLVNKMGVSESTAQYYVRIIQAYAEAGIVGGPQLTLGGTGVIPLRDIEDRHVLETALAGDASVLVTKNLKDFLSKDTHIIEVEKHLIYSNSGTSLHIVHPYLMTEWIRQNNIPNVNIKFD